MSSTDVSTESATAASPPKPGEMRLEVVLVPVSDVDRAKALLREPRVAARTPTSTSATDFRVVQFTPPGSGCSIAFGKGLVDDRSRARFSAWSWPSTTSTRRGRT